MTEMAARLRLTRSVCPECLHVIDAELIPDNGCVRMVKNCPEHGEFSAVVWRGEPAFENWVRPKIPFGGGPREAGGKGCPHDCGLCSQHAQRTCTALVEITSRCNLNCPVCFADSGHAGTDPDLAMLRRMFEQIMTRTGGCNLQLSGGEPTVRHDLPLVVRAAKDAGFGFVQLNSNGLKLAEDASLALKLAEAGLSSVFLQFDGVHDRVFTTLRGRALFELKCRAIEHIAAAGLGVVLVPTIARGVNTDQLWDIVQFGLARQPHIRGVHFQPMSYFGRYPDAFRPDHVTLPEIMTGLCAQSGGVFKATDFLPPGCEHALCSFSAKYLMQENGWLMRLGGATCDCSPKPAEEGARKSIGVTARPWGPAQSECEAISETLDDFERFLQRARTHTFSVSGMAFQDAWSLNLERLQGCCIHVAQPDGRLIPFCSYNLTSRSGQALHRSNG